jgi:hypothetical protein
MRFYAVQVPPTSYQGFKFSSRQPHQEKWIENKKQHQAFVTPQYSLSYPPATSMRPSKQSISYLVSDLVEIILDHYRQPITHSGATQSTSQ